MGRFLSSSLLTDEAGTSVWRVDEARCVRRGDLVYRSAGRTASLASPPLVRFVRSGLHFVTAPRAAHTGILASVVSLNSADNSQGRKIKCRTAARQLRDLIFRSSKSRCCARRWLVSSPAARRGSRRGVVAMCDLTAWRRREDKFSLDRDP